MRNSILSLNHFKIVCLLQIYLLEIIIYIYIYNVLKRITKFLNHLKLC